MAYTKQTWSDLPSKTTPINASRLGHIEQGIYDAAATADNASTAISAMGTAVSKNSTNAVTQNSGDLVESGAVYTAIANAKASCYKPSGDKTCAELVAGLLVQSNLGNVYNITDSGTTTSDFVGGAGKPISVGDNVAIVDVGSSVYKFDLLTGMVDLSDYQTKALSAQVEGQSTVEGALGALSNADKATRQLIDDTVGWIGKNKLNPAYFNQSGYTVSGDNVSVNNSDNRLWTSVDTYALSAGTYKLTRSNTTCRLAFRTSEDNYTLSTDINIGDNSAIFTLSTDGGIKIKGGYNASGDTATYPIVEKFMLCDASLDDTFVPYHASVEESLRNAEVILSKNLLPITLDDLKGRNTTGSWSGNVYTINSMTFTCVFSNNGYLTAVNTSGTPNANSDFVLIDKFNTKFDFDNVKNQSVILSGCPNSGSSSTYSIYGYRVGGTTNARDVGNGDTFTFRSDNVTWNIAISISSGTNTNNLVFKPMLRYASEADSTFEPYYVPLKDVVPNKADNSVIAPVEDGTTIQNPSGYAVGSHAIRNGAFITWKNAKAQGETIADSDYEIGAVGDYINITYYKTDEMTISANGYSDTVAIPSITGYKPFMVNVVVSGTGSVMYGQYKPSVNNNHVLYGFRVVNTDSSNHTWTLPAINVIYVKTVIEKNISA